MYTDNDNGINTGAVVGLVIGTLICLVAIIIGLGLLYKFCSKEKYRDDSRSFNYPEGISNEMVRRHLQAHQDGNMFLQRKCVEPRLHRINMDKPQDQRQRPRRPPLSSNVNQGEQDQRPRQLPSVGMQGGKDSRLPPLQYRGMHGESEHQASNSSQSGGCHIDFNQESSFRRDGRYSFAWCRRCQMQHSPPICEDTPSSSSQSESEDGTDKSFDSRMWCSNCSSLHSPPLCKNNPSNSSQLESNDGNDYTLNTRYSYVRCKKCQLQHSSPMCEDTPTASIHSESEDGNDNTFNSRVRCPLCSKLHLSSEKCDYYDYGCSIN